MISHPEKLLYPEDGISKGEVAAYYEAVAPIMVPHLRARPVTMERYPSGVGATGFMQKNVVKGFPAWLKRAEVPKKGGVVNYPLVYGERDLLWLANQNTITVHVWTSRVPKLFYPDLCVFDLDPSTENLPMLRAAALAVRDLLTELGLPSWVKTTGSKGFHVVTPIDGKTGFDVAGDFAQAVALELVRRDPDHLTLEFSKADRGDRILVDVGRNGPGATTAAPYSLRPRAGAPVSAPCTWAEIERGTVHPQSFNLRNMQERLAEVGDLWQGIYRHGRGLARAKQRLGRLQK